MGEKQSKHNKRVDEVVNTLEWLITAFILAFIFRAFVMEAFRIPTGSMANTLKGAHFQLCCRQCGYKYDYGFSPQSYGYQEDTVPYEKIQPFPTRCPSCGYYWPDRYPSGRGPDDLLSVANGDRILVLKCIYQFFEPKRWDVVVFKNPLDPTVNYIKRLVGLPGEEIETIDGDIYINGKIARKPPKVQNELWMPVYNNDYQPVQPRQGTFNGHTWQQPFKNEAGSRWITTDPDRPGLFCLESPLDEVHTLVYDNSIGNDFRATCAYDDVREYPYWPYCSDLMMRFYACLNVSRASSPRSEGGTPSTQATIGIILSKYETSYRAWLDTTGKMLIAKTSTDGQEILAGKQIKSLAMNKPTLVKFTNVDHQLIFQIAGEKLAYDLGSAPDDAGVRRTNIPPQAKIFGSGRLTLSHVAMFRDIHYTAKKFANSSEGGARAGEGNAFTLTKDEFFMMGDNSTNSEDGRWWENDGIGITGQRVYRAGIVPRDYLVGKALFVYWPMGYKLFALDPFGIVPNIGQLRFIYGGSKAEF